MATITSPRIANQPPSPTSSVRSSLSIDRASASGLAAPASARRNRSALRDFYNLQPSAAKNAAGASHTPSAASTATSGASTPVPEAGEAAAGGDDDDNAQLDGPDFDPQRHVESLLRTSGLGDVLRTESRLLGDIRSLDGEKKALVYDNYSKLIRATDTIGRMRGEMDEEGVGLEGVGTKLETLIGGIVEKAEGVAEKAEPEDLAKIARHKADLERHAERTRARETVQWVLQAPGRLEALVRQGHDEETEQDWQKVQSLLDKWEGVGGVSELRARCESIMSKNAPDTPPNGE